MLSSAYRFLMVLCQLKTRLVANGNHHTKGLDYNETFSPVAKQPTIRLVLSSATNYNWLVCRLDVTSAFLQGIFFFDEKTFMKQSLGLGIPLIWVMFVTRENL